MPFMIYMVNRPGCGEKRRDAEDAKRRGVEAGARPQKPSAELSAKPGVPPRSRCLRVAPARSNCLVADGRGWADATLKSGLSELAAGF